MPKNKKRNIYVLTPAGWKHRDTDALVPTGGIPLTSEDIQALKKLHIEMESKKKKRDADENVKN